MVDYPPGRIDGTRLVLRPPMLDDAGALFQRVARDPEVTKYLLWTPHPDVAATRRVITEKLNIADDDRTWAITLRNSDDVIGLTSCRRPVPHSVMLLTALQADRGVYRVWGTCHVDNERSARVLLRAGFALEGRLVRHAVYPTMGPEPQDSLLYAKALR
jgi:RimJ/RimL family protein N-acetyltransferase